MIGNIDLEWYELVAFAFAGLATVLWSVVLVLLVLNSMGMLK